ncbi:hypothetical protein [Hamadaea tsunoensis]|uniref:hypothetical protein n=1 Tax=Hamadaea tsunoensis TaxID=53368 RepID=UPI000403BC4B|nr:hypothetical protein [Hamadaea tsunoensis]
MDVPGYLEDFAPPPSTVLIDAMAWLEDELFWPAFLAQVGMARLAPAAFDADLADLSAYVERFERTDQWPVFSVSVGGGLLYLILRNYPDDAGIDWQLDATATDAVDRQAAEIGGYRPGPGLPWELLPTEADQLLLALPAVGDSAVPDGVADRVAQALRAVSAVRVDELAEELLSCRACIVLQ